MNIRLVMAGLAIAWAISTALWVGEALADKTVTVVSSTAQVTHGRFSLEKDGSVTLTVCGVATTAEGVAVEKGCTTAKVTGAPANTFRGYVNGASGLARWKTERGL